MLAGDEGETLGLCLRSLVHYGEAFGARRLVPIKSAHLTGSFRIFFFSAYYELLERLVREGLKVRVPTTVNPHPGYEFALQNRVVFHGQKHHEENLAALGVIPNYSCVCYHHHNVPHFGDILGWAESSAVIWANSVAGARTNRNSIMMDICQAVTGLTPEFGYLLDENRRGQLLVRLEIDRMDAAALGFIVGRIAVDRTPVLTHYPFSQTDLKNMGAAMASSGGVTLFHVLGLTPEAPDMAAVFDGEPPQTVTVTQQDVDALSADGDTQENSAIVVFGCPQMTLDEVSEVALHFVGRQVRKPVLFHVVPAAFGEFSQTDLYREVVRAGVQVLQHCPLAGLTLRIGPGRQQVLTTSGKLYYYLEGTKYGSLDQALRVAGVLE
jgi:cis-L-3-hydroxyproline dehydratase